MSKVQYRIKNLSGHAEKDDYKNGCEGEVILKEWDQEFLCVRVDSLLHEVACALDIDETGVTKNACEEDGRVDFERMEDEEGEKASEWQLEQWKKGKLDLYNVVYTGYVEKIIIETDIRL